MKIKSSSGKVVTVPKEHEDLIRKHIENDNHEAVHALVDTYSKSNLKSAIKRYANGGKIPKYYGGTSSLDYASWGSNTTADQVAAPKAQTYEMDPYQTGKQPTATSSSDSLAGSKGIANPPRQSDKAAGYAGYAALGTQILDSNTSGNDKYIAPRDSTWETGKATVGAAVPAAAPYIALGSSGSSYLDKAASNQKNDTYSDFLAGVGGFMDPASGWSNRNAMKKNGELTDGEALMGTAMHFALPGLDSAYYNSKHRDFINNQGNQEQLPDMRTYDQIAGSKGIANMPNLVAANGMIVPRYGDGTSATQGYPEVEYQGGESIYVPKGKGFVKYAQPKATKDNQHSNGGIQSPLPEGAVIFSKAFAKKADEAYAANDIPRMKALIQQQDNYNLRKGNPLNGTTDVTMRYGGRVRKYGDGTGNVKPNKMQLSNLDVAGLADHLRDRSATDYYSSPLEYATESFSRRTPFSTLAEWERTYKTLSDIDKKRVDSALDYFKQQSHSQNGKVRKYEGGTRRLSDYNYDPATFAQNYMGGQAYTRQQGTQGSLNDFYYIPPTAKLEPEDGVNYPGWESQVKQPTNVPNVPYGTIAGQTLQFVGQNLGNFRDINEGKHWDNVNYGTVNPEYLDPAQAIRSAKDQAAAARYNLRGVAGGNAGFYASNLRNVQTQRDKEIADTIYQYKNANAEIGNKSRYANKDIQIQAQRDEAANKGAAHNITRAAYAQIGENAANQYRDYKGGRLNKYEADLFYQMYPNYPKSAAVPQELIDYYNYKNKA